MYDVFDSNALAMVVMVNAVVFGVLGGLVTSSKGIGFGNGLFWGALLGPIGLIIAALQGQPKVVESGAQATRECPHCKEQMRRDASVCPHCQRDSEPWQFLDGYWWVERDSGWYWFDERENQWKRPADETTQGAP